MLDIITQPTTAQAGVAIAPAVQVGIYDQFGNLTDDDTDVTVQIDNNPGSSWLAGTTTVTAVNGVATFGDLWLNIVGTGYTFLVSAGALTPMVSDPFDIIPGDPYGIVVTTHPTDTAAGVAISPAVTADVLDEYGNLATQFNGLVNANLLGGVGATLLGTTAVNAIAGVVTFADLAVDKVGTGYTLLITGSGLFAGVSTSFDVTVGAPAALAFVGQPSDVVSGAAISPAVRVAVMDAYGNLVTTSTDAITLAISSGTLGGTLTVNAVGGVASFADLTVDLAGTYTLQATAGTLTATSSAFSVLPGVAATLEYAVQPSNAAAGAFIAPSIQVRALDAQGNAATGFTGAVSLALSTNPGGAAVSGDTTVNAVNGVATFYGLSLDKVGTGYQFTATSGAMSVASNAFDISAAAAATLFFSVEPSNVVAGATLAPAVVVQAVDAHGNVATGFTGTVRLALGVNAHNAVLGGTTSAAAVAGVATFDALNVAISGTGYSLVASASGLPPETSATFDVTAGLPARYELVGVPASVTVGVEIAFSVRALDAGGNVATDYAGTANITSTDAALVKPTNVSFTSGLATNVRVTFHTTGIQTLTVTDAINASLTATASVTATAFPQPTVRITDPAAGAEVAKGLVSITADGAVATGTTLVKVAILVDGVEIGNGTALPFSAQWDAKGEEDGSSHQIVAVITDAAGNVVQSVPVSVSIAKGCGCGAASGGEGSLLFGLAVAIQLIRRRRQAK
jgi:hypothetical protein